MNTISTITSFAISNAVIDKGPEIWIKQHFCEPWRAKVCFIHIEQKGRIAFLFRITKNVNFAQISLLESVAWIKLLAAATLSARMTYDRNVSNKVSSRQWSMRATCNLFIENKPAMSHSVSENDVHSANDVDFVDRVNCARKFHHFNVRGVLDHARALGSNYHALYLCLCSR